MSNAEWVRRGFEISLEKDRLDREAITKMLKATYWAHDVPETVLWDSIMNSRAYGLFSPEGEQAGIGRMVTDLSRFAWMSDVYVLPVHRGQGLGEWLIHTMINDPAVAGVRRVMLNTHDAQDLYKRFGFEEIADGSEEARRMMQLLRAPDEGN